MGKLWQRSQNGDNQPQLQQVDLTTLRISRPSVFFLTGFFTYDSTPQNIHSALSTMEKMMARRPGEQQPVDVYAWSHSGLREVFNLAAYNAVPSQRSSHNGYDVARGIIMPLVADNFKIGADGEPTGTPLPLEEARKNLRNVTFFGYSAGTITAQETYNASLKMMTKIGYSEKDAKKALNEVVLVGAAVMSRPGRERNRFTTLYMEANNDRLVKIKNRLWAPLRAMFAWCAHRLKIEPLSDSSVLISAAVKKSGFQTEDAGDKSLQEKFNALVRKRFPIKSYHELPRYVTEDEHLSSFARIVQYGLTNAVNRTGPVTPLDLLEPPKGVPAPDAQTFREKIAKAKLHPKRVY